MKIAVKGGAGGLNEVITWYTVSLALIGCVSFAILVLIGWVILLEH